MRGFSREERKTLNALIKSKQITFDLTDFLRPTWKMGQFEISTFMQVVQMRFDDPGHKDLVVSQIVETLNLIKLLEEKGYLSVWNEIPEKDNTKVVGKVSVLDQPHFLPDLGLASECLKYGGYKIRFNEAFYHDFKRARAPQPSTLATIGIVLLVILLGTDIYLNQKLLREEMKGDHFLIGTKNEQVLENQRLNQIIIDSLKSQGDELVTLTRRISSNTENTKDLELLILGQQRNIQKLASQQEETITFIKETDSLLKTVLTQDQ